MRADLLVGSEHVRLNRADDDDGMGSVDCPDPAAATWSIAQPASDEMTNLSAANDPIA